MHLTVEKRVARALSLALQQPTLASGGDQPFAELHTILRELFPLLFSRAHFERVEGRALLGCLPGTEKAQPLLFLSHLDVAPVHDEEKWSVPPFSGEIKDGFVYGRGAADMKGHLIALLTAAESLLSQNFQPRGDIWFAFSCDEEIRGSSMRNMCRMLEARGVRPAFVLDEGGQITHLPSLCEKQTALIGVQEKGRMCFTLTSQGENAMEALMHASQRLLRMHFMPRICDTTGRMLQSLSGEMEGVSRYLAARPGKWQHYFLRKMEKTVYGRALSRTQLSVSALKGDALRGEEAAITFQASVLPGEEAAELLKRIERVIGDPRILMTVDVMDEPSLVSPVSGAAWEALITAVQVHFPDALPVPYLLTGGSDARRMESLCPYIYRFSPFILPPEEMGRIHGKDERMSIENLFRGVEFFKQMLMA